MLMPASPGAGQSCRFGGDGVQLGEGPVDQRQHARSERRGRDPAGGSVEQALSEAVLQPGDAIGQRGLGDAVRAGRGAER